MMKRNMLYSKLSCAQARVRTHKFYLHRFTLQDGTTALQMACLNGHVEVVQWLLDSRADPDMADKVLTLHLLPPALPPQRPFDNNNTNSLQTKLFAHSGSH